MSEGDNYVGYRHPPMHTRFVPGESGNKGRKKKRPEFQTEIVARVRDKQVQINGESITMFEVAIQSVMNATIKRGHPRDLKILFDLLDKYGAVPKGEAAEQSRAAADQVMKNIMASFDRTNNVNPDDSVALDKLKREEAKVVMKCPNCSSTLRQRWNLPERLAFSNGAACRAYKTTFNRRRRSMIDAGHSSNLEAVTPSGPASFSTMVIVGFWRNVRYR